MRRSLFFRFNSGKFRVVDDDYDFDARNFLTELRNDNDDDGNFYGVDFDRVRRYRNVRNIFEDVDTIGGGCGLDRISPFFQGRGKFRYDWDDKIFERR